MNCLQFSSLFLSFLIVVFGSYTNEKEDRYILVSDEMDWESAQSYCRSHYNTDLATIISDSDFYEASQLINANTWIGLNDIDKEGIFEWKDGSKCSNAPNNVCAQDPNFLDGEPDNGANSNTYNTKIEEDCVWITNELKFSDQDCELERAFLCNSPDYNDENEYDNNDNDDNDNDYHYGNDYDKDDKQNKNDDYNHGSKKERYILISDVMDWESAQSHCHRYYNTDLATIISDSDIYEASKLISANTWIGLNDIDKEGIFEWKDGSKCTNAPNNICSKDPNFLDGEPDNGANSNSYNKIEEDCVWITTELKFSDQDCKLERAFLCNAPDDEY